MSFTTFVSTVRRRAWRWRRRLSTRRFDYDPMQAKRISRARDIFIADTSITRGLLAELEIAGQTLPNDARLFELKGYVERRRPGGNQEEALRNFEKALDLDPRNVLILHQTASSCSHARRYAEEEAVLDRLLAIEPNDADTKVWRGFVDFDWKADTRSLHQSIDEIRVKNPAALKSVSDSWFYCALAERELLLPPML